VLGDKGRRIRELTSLIQKRFKFEPNTVELYAERVQNRGLCAIAQAESLKYKLLGGLAARRACYGVMRFIMENGARGVEVVISGKLRGQRAKSMVFRDGYMIKSGAATKYYVDRAVRHILLKAGVLGVNLSIMLPYDPTGKEGCAIKQADVVTIHEPKEEAPLPVAPKQGFAQNIQQPADQGTPGQQQQMPLFDIISALGTQANTVAVVVTSDVSAPIFTQQTARTPAHHAVRALRKIATGPTPTPPGYTPYAGDTSTFGDQEGCNDNLPAPLPCQGQNGAAGVRNIACLKTPSRHWAFYISNTCAPAAN